MLTLVLDVLDHLSSLGLAYRKHAVTVLPSEFAQMWKFLMYPFRRFAF